MAGFNVPIASKAAFYFLSHSYSSLCHLTRPLSPLFPPAGLIPGPKLAAGTNWYKAYLNLVKGIGRQLFSEVDRMHQRYDLLCVSILTSSMSMNPEFYQVLYAGQPAQLKKWSPAAAILGTTLENLG